METKMNMTEFKKLLVESAEAGAKEFARTIGLAKSEISQREAYRKFTEARVRSWKNQKLLTTLKPGKGKNATVYYLLSELEACDRAEKMLKSK